MTQRLSGSGGVRETVRFCEHGEMATRTGAASPVGGPCRGMKRARLRLMCPKQRPCLGAGIGLRLRPYPFLPCPYFFGGSLFPALIAGIADDLAAHTDCIWRPHGIYQEEEIGIVVGEAPAEPDRVVALRVFGFATDGQGDETVHLQVRVRGIPHDLASCETAADAIRDRLAFLEQVTIGGYAISGIFHDSGPIPLGTDENWRYQLTDNYRVALVRYTSTTAER